MPLFDSLSTDLLARRQLRALRFLSYAGSQFSSLLVPLIVFQLTRDVAVAAIVLVAERIAKVLLYVPAGVLVRAFGVNRVHHVVEALRWLSLIGLLGFALGYFNSMAWLILPAVVSHGCAGLMNVVFELGVARLWPQKDRVVGYAAIIRDEQLGLFFALLGGVLLGRVDLLCGLALISQTINFALLWRSRRSLYAETHVPPEQAGENWTQLKAEVGAVCQKPLLKFGLASILTGLPVTVVYTAGPYYLARSAPELTEPTRWYSFLLMASAVGTIAMIHFLGHRMHQQLCFNRSVKGGFAAVLIFSILCTPVLPFAGAVAAGVALSISGASFLLGQRHYRQVLITKHVPVPLRPGVTSLMLSLEAWRYLGGALILLVYPGPLAGAIILATALAALGAWKHPIHGWLRKARPDSFTH